THRLNAHHERKGEQRRPEYPVPNSDTDLCIRGDAAGIIVGGTGDEPRPEPFPERLRWRGHLSLLAHEILSAPLLVALEASAARPRITGTSARALHRNRRSGCLQIWPFTELGPLGIEAAQERIVGLDELLDSFVLQLLGDLLEVDAELAERPHNTAC